MHKEILSDNAFGVQLRIMPTLVKNNGVSSFRIFNPKAKLYYLTLVFEDINNCFNGLINVDVFDGVHRNDYLNVNKVVYDWQGTSIKYAPDRIILISSIIKSNKPLVAIDSIIKKMHLSSDYQECTDLLFSMISEPLHFVK